MDAIPIPNTREMSEQYAFTVLPRGWDDGTHRGWAIEVDGRFAGNIDIRQSPIADIGFALHPSARGRGVMARAVRLAVDWALNEGGVEIVHWRSHVGNEASLRVAHQTGFTLHGLMPGMLHERSQVIDAWTGSFRFGDSPLPRTQWAESTVLESDRLRLRPFTEADVPRIAEACSDPVIRHFLAGLPHPYTPAIARSYLADCVWQAATGAKATWAVADRETDELLGNIAVMDMLGINPTSGEIGYWMHPAARGRGLMTEAVRDGRTPRPRSRRTRPAPARALCRRRQPGQQRGRRRRRLHALRHPTRGRAPGRRVVRRPARLRAAALTGICHPKQTDC